MRILERKSNQRIWALLLILGASILLFRTLRLMLLEQGLEILMLWVVILTIVEFVIDLSCIICSLRWFTSNQASKAILPLRLGATAAIFHAVRVSIYVLGRTGPWVNFDVKPMYRSSYSFDWFWVWFAATLSVLGVVGVIVIWRLRRRSREST